MEVAQVKWNKQGVFVPWRLVKVLAKRGLQIHPSVQRFESSIAQILEAKGHKGMKISKRFRELLERLLAATLACRSYATEHNLDGFMEVMEELCEFPEGQELVRQIQNAVAASGER